jgi:hypothetical protein
LKNAICYARKRYPNEKISLGVERELSGSYGNGPVDYVVYILSESDNMNKGIAQLIVQMYSAWEIIKRDNEPLLEIYGIVSTAVEWRFVSLSGALDNPEVKISQTYICSYNSYNDSMEAEKEILTYITKIICNQYVHVKHEA